MFVYPVYLLHVQGNFKNSCSGNIETPEHYIPKWFYTWMKNPQVRMFFIQSNSPILKCLCLKIHPVHFKSTDLDN